MRAGQPLSRHQTTPMKTRSASAPVNCSARRSRCARWRTRWIVNGRATADRARRLSARASTFSSPSGIAPPSIGRYLKDAGRPERLQLAPAGRSPCQRPDLMLLPVCRYPCAQSVRPFRKRIGLRDVRRVVPALVQDKPRATGAHRVSCCWRLRPILMSTDPVFLRRKVRSPHFGCISTPLDQPSVSRW